MLTPLQLLDALRDLWENQICWLETAEDARQVAVAARAAADPAAVFEVRGPVSGSTLHAVREVPTAGVRP